jgi:hypothetical protein
MSIEEIFSDGIETSKKLLDDTSRLLILVIIGVIPIINIMLSGYAARIIRSGKPELPEVKDFGGLFIDGLKIVITVIIYFIIPLALIGFGAGAAYFSGFIAAPFMILGVILSLIIAVIASMGIIHMIYTNSMGKAFAFGDVFEIIGTFGWGNYIIWVLAVWVILLIISSISQLTPIGWVISAFLMPFFTVFTARTGFLIYARGAGILLD